MKNTRRDFLKTTGLTGVGLLGAGFIGSGCQTNNADPFPQRQQQTFNMSGYAAPRLEVVRVGVIGIGDRGSGSVSQYASIEGVEIKALSDLEADRVQNSADRIQSLGHTPDLYSGHEDEWKKVCERSDIDLIVIATPWHLHTPMAVFAMEHDKHVSVQLPAATTIDECWQLVETSERTRKHCVQISASCHRDVMAANFNMVKQGFFGDIIHGEGNYIHELINDTYFFHSRDKFHNQWRIKENIGKHGNLYAGHGFTPLVQMMDINCGDKLEYLSSVSSNDFNFAEAVKKYAEQDDIWEQFIGKEFRGNMNITIIRTAKGRTIELQHDISSPRPRPGGLLSGSKAIYQGRPDRWAISDRRWLNEEEGNELVEEYTPEMVKRFDEITRQATSDHARSGYYDLASALDWRVIDSLRNGVPMDLSVYEAAVTSCIMPLSIWSVANRTNSVTVPDFTRGAWETNQNQLDIHLQNGGGSTRLR
ncbi:MAG: Gfo/Idh/MocA family oxidoreductase [Balneolales bacterium]